VILPFWTNHALNAAVQGFHSANPRKHCRSARRRD
jgi:hypothetical protein